MKKVLFTLGLVLCGSRMVLAQADVIGQTTISSPSVYDVMRTRGCNLDWISQVLKDSGIRPEYAKKPLPIIPTRIYLRRRNCTDAPPRVVRVESASLLNAPRRAASSRRVVQRRAPTLSGPVAPETPSVTPPAPVVIAPPPTPPAVSSVESTLRANLRQVQDELASLKNTNKRQLLFWALVAGLVGILLGYLISTVVVSARNEVIPLSRTVNGVVYTFSRPLWKCEKCGASGIEIIEDHLHREVKPPNTAVVSNPTVTMRP